MREPHERGPGAAGVRLHRLLLGVFARTVRARLREAPRQSRLLSAVLLAFILGYLALGYLLFHHGLRQVDRFPVVGPLLAQRILFLVFLFFFLMLVFSNVIIGYSALFRSAETTWLISLPAPHADVYAWKTLESIVVSSWALLFLSVPMIAAFGQVNRVPAVFYIEAASAFLPFVILPAVCAAWVLLLLVRFLGARWFKILLAALFAGGLAALWIAVRPAGSADAEGPVELLSFDTLLRHSRVSLHPLLPSAWMARCLLCWSDEIVGQGFFYFLVLLSNALFGLLLCFSIGGAAFYPSWAGASDRRVRRAGRRAPRRRPRTTGRPWIERLCDRFPAPGRTMRALFLKDARLFWRDPTQWTQFLIFFGLLGIYVLNLRNVSAESHSPFWSTVISFLNLGACALTLSTLTTRFVFPQFSLEGRRLWIVGMAPVGLGRVVLQKFAGSAVATLAVTVALMMASSLMLRLPWAQVAFFAGAIGAMSVALSGLAAGLGALFPNVREDNPSKIVSGFGGTLCLVLSFLYILLVIALLALPQALEISRARPDRATLDALRALCAAAAAALSAATAGAPLALALRRVKTLEF